MALPGCRIDPAQKAAEFDKADPVLAREISISERGGGAHREVEGRIGRRAGFRQRVEEQHHIRIPLLVKLRDVKLLATERGAPVDMAGSVTGQEGPDFAWLDPLAEARRDVIAERELRPNRLRHVTDARDIGIDRDRFRSRLPVLENRHAGAVP